MTLEFIKDYYQKINEIEEKPDKLYTMYHFNIHENYYEEDKNKILKQVIKDLTKELDRLKEIDRKNNKAMESWDSIEK